MESKTENLEWGGSGIEKVVFDFIKANVPEGSTVIELGSGHVSTPALSSCYNLYSVEHNTSFAFHYDNVNYILCDLTSDWYSIKSSDLPPIEEQRMILIDGITPRNGILNHLDLFNHNALFVIHDTYREEEFKLANDLAEKLGRKVVFHTEGDFWASI